MRDLSCEKLITHMDYCATGISEHVDDLIERWDNWMKSSVDFWIPVGEPTMELIDDPAIDAKRLKLFWRAAWMGGGEPPMMTHFIVPSVGLAAVWGENFV